MSSEVHESHETGPLGVCNRCGAGVGGLARPCRAETPAHRRERQRGRGWIGVDLDGTLAHYDHWRGPAHVGPPIPAMLERVRGWLADDWDVRIFTARVSRYTLAKLEATSDWDGMVAARAEALVVEEAIDAWCREHLGRTLPITCVKDYGMIELWDDRCVQVEPNTGRPLAGDPAAELAALRGKP